MYPKWVEEICRTPCECHGVPDIDDIVAIGVARPGKGAEFVGPMAMVMVVCPKCGQLMNITVREPLKSVIAAMRELVEMIGDAARKTPPPINLPRRAPQPTNNDPGARANQPPRPSVRKDQPIMPPTQREIQRFLRRLRKTSFNRSSKSFSDWMKEMGAGEHGDNEQ